MNTRYTNNNNKTFEQCRRQLFKAVCVCVCVCVFLCAHTIHPCVHFFFTQKKKNSKNKTLNKKTPEIFSLFVLCLLFETHTKHLRDAFVRRPTLHSRKEKGVFAFERRAHRGGPPRASSSSSSSSSSFYFRGRGWCLFFGTRQSRP